MARLGLPGNSGSERVRQLVESIQEALSSQGNGTTPSINVQNGAVNTINTPMNTLGSTLTTLDREPRNLRRLLESLLNQSVVVTTEYEPISGTLIAVRSDYIVVVESTANVTLIPINQIEYVTPT